MSRAGVGAARRPQLGSELGPLAPGYPFVPRGSLPYEFTHSDRAASPEYLLCSGSGRHWRLALCGVPPQGHAPRFNGSILGTASRYIPEPSPTPAYSPE
jgi:hypothetical protein